MGLGRGLVAKIMAGDWCCVRLGALARWCLCCSPCCRWSLPVVELRAAPPVCTWGRFDALVVILAKCSSGPSGSSSLMAVVAAYRQRE